MYLLDDEEESSLSLEDDSSSLKFKDSKSRYLDA